MYSLMVLSVDNWRADSYVSPRYSPIVQLVERWTVNPYVAGSSPARGAILSQIFKVYTLLCINLFFAYEIL